MSFKLTIWAMLFIIVVVLALSYFMKTSVSQEGFGSYKHDAHNNSKTKILVYSSTKELVKLFDCLYYDESNGNIIEVVSPEYINDTETPTGVFTGINVIKRSDGSSKQYIITPNKDESGQTTYNASSKEGTNVTINDSSATFNETASISFKYETKMTVPQYAVFVHANNKETLIHILDKTNNLFKISYVFEKDGAPEFNQYTNTPYSPGTPTHKDNNKAPVPGRYIKVSDNVIYDNINENVLVSTDTTNLLAISSDGSVVETPTNEYISSENDKTRENWIKSTTAGNTILYYPSPNEKGVFIGVIETQPASSNTTATEYVVDTTKRFIHTSTATPPVITTGYYINANDGILYDKNDAKVTTDLQGATIAGYKFDPQSKNLKTIITNNAGSESFGAVASEYSLDTTTYFKKLDGTTGLKDDGNQNIVDSAGTTVVTGYSIHSDGTTVMESGTSVPEELVFKSVYVAYPTETNVVSDNNTVTETETTTTQTGALSELENAFAVLERGKALYGHLFGLDASAGAGGVYGEDYFLKTEVVPPVCPTCPSCANGCSGVCNDCGGNGGSGTKGSDGKSITGNNKNGIEKTVDSAGNGIEKTVDSAGNAIEKTVDSAGNVIEKTVDSAGNVIEKTLDSAGNVISEVGAGTKQVAGDVYGAIGTAGTGAKQVAGDVYGAIGTAGTGAKQVAGDIYGATTGVAGDIYGATTGVAGDIYGAATGVIGDLYSGVTNLSGATQLPARQQVGNTYSVPVQGQPQMNMTGTSQMPSYQNSVTNYDYYGALPSKSSNYVARTADFSSFSK